mmetsp:Transcript_45421/g.140356  ORF Transcript_45421/g.140356 Transcript_45421/m.140356 type:complete len:137 (+) Transcript_45421:62-472(+)
MGVRPCVDTRRGLSQQQPPFDFFFFEESFLEESFFEVLFEDVLVGATAAATGATEATGAGEASGTTVVVGATCTGSVLGTSVDGIYILPPPLTNMSGALVQPPAANVLAVSGAGAVPLLGTYMPPPPLTSTCDGIE